MACGRLDMGGDNAEVHGQDEKEGETWARVEKEYG